MRDTGAKPGLVEAFWVWAKIGLLSFGGPAGQIALMHRILVVEKRWIDERRFLHALNFCMLLPGPEAQQLATYVGWMLHRIRGGLIAGTLFILPGFIVILCFSYLYVTAGSLSVVQGVFAGLKPAVVVIVIQALARIGRRSLQTAPSAFLAVVAFLALFVFNIPFPYVVVSAILVGLVARFVPRVTFEWAGVDGAADGQPAESADPLDLSLWYALRCVAIFGTLWLLPIVLLSWVYGPEHVFVLIGVFFSKMAVVTFGGAYAVLGYVSQEAVLAQSWLSAAEMIDGLALAETTPGPLIMVVEFVAYLAAYRAPGALSPETAALLGATLATWVTFVPCFLWVFLGAPHMERLRDNRALGLALGAVTAAVVGVIASLALWFSMHALFGETTVVHLRGIDLELPVLGSLRFSSLFIAGVCALLLFRMRLSVPLTLLVASALGIGFQLLIPPQ